MVLSSQISHRGSVTPSDSSSFLNTRAAQEPKKAVEDEKLTQQSTASRPPMGWLGAMGLILGTVVFWCVLFKAILFLLGRFH